MEKKKKIVVIGTLILLLAVGFAAISTNLIINNTTTIGKNVGDFDIDFTKAIIDGVNTPSLISDDNKKITFTTKTLKATGDTSVLDYEITNNSKIYDAKIIVSCDNIEEEYYKVEYKTPERINSLATESGSVTITQMNMSVENKEYSVECKIIINALERESLGSTTYSVSGILRDNAGNPITNKTVMVFSNVNYTKTTSDGYFFVGGLEKNTTHEIYISDKTIEELQAIANDEDRKDASTKIAEASIDENGNVTYNNETGYSVNNPLTVSKNWKIADENKNGTVDINETIMLSVDGSNETFHIYREEGDFYWALRDTSIQNSAFGENTGYNGSTVEGLVNAYKEKLNNAGGEVLEATLISNDELKNVFKCDNENSKCRSAKVQSYFKSTVGYWTQSSDSSSAGIVVVADNKTIVESDLTKELEVRPVIKIAKGQFNSHGLETPTTEGTENTENTEE